MYLPKSGHFLTNVAGIFRGDRLGVEGNPRTTPLQTVTSKARSLPAITAYNSQKCKEILEEHYTAAGFKIRTVLIVRGKGNIARYSDVVQLWQLRTRLPPNDSTLYEGEQRIDTRVGPSYEDKIFLRCLIALVLICLAACIVDEIRVKDHWLVSPHIVCSVSGNCRQLSGPNPIDRLGRKR